MASTGAAQHLHPHSELRRSKRLILGGSKKKAQFLEFSSSLMQNEEKQMEINAVPNRPQTEKGNAAGNDKLFLCSKERSDSGFQDLPNIEARAIVGGGGGRISGSTITFGSPRTTRSRQQRAGTFDLDNPSLYYPILPNNPNFFCCFGFLHITTVAKLLSLLYMVFYGLLCYFSYKSDHAPSFLIAVLVALSVGFSTIYSSFHWSKHCLIPFFLLQSMLILYALVCIILLGIATFSSSSSYLHKELSVSFEGWLQMNTRSWICIILLMFIVVEAIFCYTTLLFWFNYQFIAEVDRFLKSIRKPSSQPQSKDDQGFGGTNGNYTLQTTSFY